MNENPQNWNNQDDNFSPWSNNQSSQPSAFDNPISPLSQSAPPEQPMYPNGNYVQQTVEKKGMSPGAIVALTLGAVALVGAGAFILSKYVFSDSKSEKLSSGESAVILESINMSDSEGVKPVEDSNSQNNASAEAIQVTSLSDTSMMSVELSFYEVTMKVGDTRMPGVTVYPVDAANQQIKWSSSNEKVAYVDGLGNITAVGAGTCAIRVESVSNPAVFAEVNVNVQNATATTNVVMPYKECDLVGRINSKGAHYIYSYTYNYVVEKGPKKEQRLDLTHNMLVYAHKSIYAYDIWWYELTSDSGAYLGWVNDNYIQWGMDTLSSTSNQKSSKQQFADKSFYYNRYYGQEYELMEMCIAYTNTTSAYVNLRSEANTNSKIVLQIPPQTYVGYTGANCDMPAGENWYWVEVYCDNQWYNGYIRSDLLSE